MEGGKPVIVPNAEGARTTPSVVAWSKSGDRLVGTVSFFFVVFYSRIGHPFRASLDRVDRTERIICNGDCIEKRESRERAPTLDERRKTKTGIGREAVAEGEHVGRSPSQSRPPLSFSLCRCPPLALAPRPSPLARAPWLLPTKHSRAQKRHLHASKRRRIKARERNQNLPRLKNLGAATAAPPSRKAAPAKRGKKNLGSHLLFLSSSLFSQTIQNRKKTTDRQAPGSRQPGEHLRVSQALHRAQDGRGRRGVQAGKFFFFFLVFSLFFNPAAASLFVFVALSSHVFLPPQTPKKKKNRSPTRSSRTRPATSRSTAPTPATSSSPPRRSRPRCCASSATTRASSSATASARP